MMPLLSVGIVQCFFAGLLIATKKPQHLPDRFLAALLFLMGIEMLLHAVRLLKIEQYGLLLTTDPFPFAYGPLLLLYTQSMINEKFRFRLIHWLHFIPLTGFLIFTAFFANKPVIPVDLTHFLLYDPYQPARLAFGIWFLLSILIYGIIILYLIYKHQKNIREVFSYTSGKITLQWLKLLSLTFFIGYNLLFIIAVLNVFDLFYYIDPMNYSFIGLTFMAFAISFFGFKQPAIFREDFQYHQEQIDENISSSYERSGLTDQDIVSIKLKIIGFFDSEKPYLRGDLSLSHLAEMMQIPKHHLTQVFNVGMAKNFYTFVNDYRVEEAKKRLLDPRNTKYSILAIAFDSGFNSKTAFNTIFKKYTGKTPSHFREENSFK